MVLIEHVIEFIEVVAEIIAFLGIVTITYGAAAAFGKWIQIRSNRKELDEPHLRLQFTRMREQFANRIVFGLDFLIAGDLIITVAVPNLEEVARLAGIVLIRAVLTIILSRETKELKSKEEEEEEHPHEPIPHP